MYSEAPLGEFRVYQIELSLAMLSHCTCVALIFVQPAIALPNVRLLGCVAVMVTGAAPTHVTVWLCVSLESKFSLSVV